MEIIKKEKNNHTLKLVTTGNEESLFSLLKVYLEKDSDVEVVGLYKEHHLTDRVEFVIKTKKSDPEVLLKKALKSIKKEVNSLKIK